MPGWSTRRRAPLSRALRSLALGVLAVSVAAVFVPVAAQAAERVTVPAVGEQCHAALRGSGQMDAQGWLYLVCDRSVQGARYNSIHVFDAGGVLQRMVPLRFYATDVAPSPDGTSLYVARGDDRNIARLAGSKFAGYTLDGAWRLQNLPAGGTPNAGNLVRGEYVATDAAGALYVSSGLWDSAADRVDRWNPARTNVPVADTIAKFRPDGTYVTNFGTAGNSWAKGVAYDEWTGLAVSASGNRVFVGDKMNSRIHRFVRTAGTEQYTADIEPFGNTAALDPNRGGTCNTAGRLAAPYDLTMTPGGELLVINSTCRYAGNVPAHQPLPANTIEVQRFGQDGASRGLIQALAQFHDEKVHGIAIDRAGYLHLPQAGIKIPPSAAWSDASVDAANGPLGATAQAVSVGPTPNPVPGSPDTTRPVIRGLASAQVGTSRTVTITVDATDDQGIVDMRTAEDQKPFPWRGGFATTVQHTLPAYGSTWVAVLVADAAGNDSGWTWVLATANDPAAGGGGAAPKPAPTPKPDAPKADPAPKPAGAAPVISRVQVPPSTKNGKVRIAVGASDIDGGKLRVRFATESGKWGSWQPLGARTVTLSRGIGWKGVFIQVGDAQGNTSRLFFQSTLSVPKATKWLRGGSGVDRLRGTRGADHVDLSRFDGKVDTVRCGAGFDTVLLQREDRAAKDCERVLYVRTPAS